MIVVMNSFGSIFHQTLAAHQWREMASLMLISSVLFGFIFVPSFPIVTALNLKQSRIAAAQSY